LAVFVPALTTAVVALMLSPRRAAALSYIGGSIGTLIGADLIYLGHVQGLAAPVASIGGAGTFDGIFLTGILAVMLASLSGGTGRNRGSDTELGDGDPRGKPKAMEAKRNLWRLSSRVASSRVRMGCSAAKGLTRCAD
jgi:Protein of unknown function (DUF1614)